METNNTQHSAMEVTDAYTACGIIEGFGGWDEYEGPDLTIKAWAYLIKTGQAWHLQGFYGRGASEFIAKGIIDRDGTIHMEKLHHAYDE